MANPMWVAGGKSANPAGRPKQSVRSPKGMLLRFINRNLSPRKVQELYDKLTEKDKLAFLTELLPYVLAKQSAEGLNPDEIEQLYAKLEQRVKDHANAV